MRERRLIGFGVLVLLVSCSTASPSGSQAPGASVQPAAGCPDLDIVGPTGTHVQLTGAWRANDQGTYYIHQRESCINWLGMSQDLGSGPGQDWTNVFTGIVHGDFTITGQWGDVPLNPDIESDLLRNGMAEIQIDFDQSSEVVRPVLRLVEGTGGFGGLVWVREESLSAPTDLEGPFGGNPEQNCVWVEADGQRVELIGSGEWTFRDPPLSVQDGSGHIFARVGDVIRVHGQLSTALGSGCADTAIVVEALVPPP